MKIQLRRNGSYEPSKTATSREYQVANQTNSKVEEGSNVNICSWDPPLEGVSMVNWDATLCRKLGKVGIRIIIKDHESQQVIATKRMQRDFCQDLVLAESYGAFQVVSFALKVCVRKIITKDDVLHVVRSILSKKLPIIARGFSFETLNIFNHGMIF